MTVHMMLKVQNLDTAVAADLQAERASQVGTDTVRKAIRAANF
jgi:DNA-binding ferritin-like protein